MPPLLTDAQVEQYRVRGYVFPFRALNPAEAAAARREIEEFEATIGDEAQKFLSFKAHLPFRFLSDIIRNPRILDAVEDVLGPNLLCWGSSFFQKNANDPRFISWHQDSYYYGMDPPNTCTAWLAFSTSDETSGSVRVIPGSHRREMEFVNTPSQNNLLPRGQTIVGVDESKAVHMNLEPGEFSIHHEAIVHNSEPNRSDDRRIGLSIHYIPTSTRQVRYVEKGRKPLAALVRGVDEFGYWDREPVTEMNYDPAMFDKLMQMRREFFARQR
jgi:ectoine hydroxylase-related dioxygenase (phytanoyl-CoA dioxygenase family)